MIVLSDEGRIISSLGGVGTGPGRFENTSGLCVDPDGNAYVSDWQLHRVQQFSPDGKQLAIIGNKPDATLFKSGPTSIAVDASGDLYAGDGSEIV